MTQHQVPRTLDLREADQDALMALKNIKWPHPELITRKRGMSRQEHEDIVSSAIEEIEVHMTVIENLRAAIAQPKQLVVTLKNLLTPEEVVEYAFKHTRQAYYPDRSGRIAFKHEQIQSFVSQIIAVHLEQTTAVKL